MKLIDVTVPLDAVLATYPGDTPFQLEPAERRARGDAWNVSTLHMSAHTGTHVDAPRHLWDDEPGVDALPLEMLCGRTRVIELTTRKAVTPGIATSEAMTAYSMAVDPPWLRPRARNNDSISSLSGWPTTRGPCRDWTD